MSDITSAETSDVASEIEGLLAGNTPDQAPEPADEVTPQQTEQQPEPNSVPATPDPSEIGDNPAWGPIREAVGEETYAQLKPLLAAREAEYQKGITKANAEAQALQAYRPFADAGVDPTFLQQAVGFAQQLDQNPADVYHRLGELLQEQGLLEEAAAAHAVADEMDEGLENEVDPRVAQLEQQVELLTQTLQQAQQQAIIEQETDKLEQQYRKEIDDIRAANPTLPDTAYPLIIEQANAILASTGKVPSLTKVAERIIDLHNSSLNTPRPSDNAPRLPGSGGGVPTTTKKFEDLSKDESIDFMASLLESAKNQ